MGVEERYVTRGLALAGLGGALCAAIVAVISSIGADAAAPSERARIAAVTRPTTNFDKPEPFERRPAGAATVFKALNADIFSHASANMSFSFMPAYFVPSTAALSFRVYPAWCLV